MKNIVKSKVCAVLLVLLLIAICCAGYYWQLPKFHGLTLELGAEKPQLADFLTDQANPKWAGFVTESVTTDVPGDQSVTLTHLWREETVTLTVEDTTAPEATFRDVTLNLGKEPTPEMFVAEASDLTELTYSFAQALPEQRQDGPVTVVVTDTSGNAVSQECRVTYEWLKTQYTLELGIYLQAADLLLDPSFGEDLIDQEALEPINNGGVGQYPLKFQAAMKDYTCLVTVQDTTAPNVVVQDVSVYRDSRVTPEQFVVSAMDLSGIREVRFAEPPSCKEYGSFPVTIEAEDLCGNVATVEATLRVVREKNPPKFRTMSEIKVEKHTKPDYVKDVKAHDSHDGYLEFTYNDSAVNLAKAGTYYVIYTAVDHSGNVGTYKRKVTVLHDAEDTAALVKAHAQKCGTSIKDITDYVRSDIRYSTDWGGDDPVWFGFTNRKGNCYVHALCLQSLLKEHGYDTKLIWVEDKSHYWLIVDMGGYWRHIDATPYDLHARYPFMTDQQRLETLSGREWDTSLWPACE